MLHARRVVQLREIEARPSILHRLRRGAMLPVIVAASIVLAATAGGFAVDRLVSPSPIFTDIDEEGVGLKRRLPSFKLQAVPLEEVIAALSESVGMKIEVDWESLALSGVARSTPVSLNLPRDFLLRNDIAMVFAHAGARRVVLDAPIDGGAIRVIDRRDVRHHVVCRYSVHDCMIGPREKADIAQYFRDVLADDDWTYEPPISKTGAEMWFEDDILVVRNHPEVQKYVQTLLERERSTHRLPRVTWLSGALTFERRR